MNKTTVLLFILLIFSAHSLAADPNAILKAMEDNAEVTTDVSAQVQMTQQKANQGTKAFEMRYYRRDKDDAFLILMTAPEAERGNGYLREGEHFWMYRRNTRTFQHINRDESIGGSDAKGDDFESRRLTELYAPAKQGGTPSEEMLGQVPVYKFSVQAKVSDVDYPRKTYWVRRDNSLTLKEESYSNNNTLMQTSYYPKYNEVNGKYVPARMIFIDEFEKGNRTVVDISKISTAKLDDAIFTKAYLESQSK